MTIQQAIIKIILGDSQDLGPLGRGIRLAKIADMLMKSLPHKNYHRVIEVGGGVGQTAARLLPVCYDNTQTLTVIDPWEETWNGEKNGYTYEAFTAAMLEAESRAGLPIRSVLDVVRHTSTSQEGRAALINKVGRPALTFLDGDQSYRSVFVEVNMATRVALSAVVCIDDIQRDGPSRAAMWIRPPMYHCVNGVDGSDVMERYFIYSDIAGRDACGY